MPVALVFAFLEMLPRLQAEAQLQTVRAARIASASADDYARFERALERAADPDRKQARSAPIRSDALPAMGLGVKMVDAEGRFIDV